MASPLATAEPEQEHSEQMEQVARQADRQTCHGLELAGRGAHFAARSEFFAALRLIAEGLDTERKTNVHGRALAAALAAMKEAEDFLPGAPRLESDPDLAGVIAGHSTPVLKSVADGATPMTALRCYLTFAQEQFAAAAGREVAGSMVLRALGKLHEALAGKKAASEPAAESKAMVFYQAALLVYPGNYMAANDLGVLLARSGNSAEARAILEYSLSLSPQPATCRNLAVVYRQLGQPSLAEQAGRRAAALEQVELARRKTMFETANQTIRWVDPQKFAETSRNMPNALNVAPLSSAQAAGQPVEPGRLSPAAGQPDGAAGLCGRDPRTAGQAGSDTPSRSARRPTTAERMTWGPPPYQR
jgi:tetratricopeptide (TPR) repeat protein